jgi:hypothetical protein
MCRGNLSWLPVTNICVGYRTFIHKQEYAVSQASRVVLVHC